MNQRSYSYDRTARRDTNQYPADENSSAGQGRMESGRQCAYNQTRSRFLSADVDSEDSTQGSLDQRLCAVMPSSGVGLLLAPFKGISPTSVRIPVDLIYLDRSCKVIELVESFPLMRASASGTQPVGVLVLPAETIGSTETKIGDQLLVCPPEEMKRRLQKLASAASEDQAAKEELARAGTGRVLQWEDWARPKSPFDRPADEEAVREAAVSGPAALLQTANEAAVADTSRTALETIQRAIEPVQAAPALKPAKTKSWLQKLLGTEPPDPRKADRECLQGLTAYFFTGGAPVAHQVRDISLTGLYVLTSERWYPGTMVRMTLTDRHEPTMERSITLHASVMRSGEDGVGLRFVLQSSRGRGYDGTAETADVYLVAQFIERLRSANA
jgi:hypothetical protein